MTSEIAPAGLRPHGAERFGQLLAITLAFHSQHKPII